MSEYEGQLMALRNCRRKRERNVISFGQVSEATTTKSAPEKKKIDLVGFSHSTWGRDKAAASCWLPFFQGPICAFHFTLSTLTQPGVIRRCCDTLVMRFVCLCLVHPVHCSVICLFSLVMFAFHLVPSENLCRCRKQRRIFLSLHTLCAALLLVPPPFSYFSVI